MSDETIVPSDVTPTEPTEDTPISYTQADLDRARTQASKTAYENARKQVMTDAEVEKYYRERFEQEAAMTAEQKYQAELDKLQATQKDLAVKESRLFAKQKLVDSGFAGDNLDSILDFVVSSDIKDTEGKIDRFLGLFNESLDAKVKEKTKEIIQDADTPRGGGELSESATLKAKLDSLANDNSPSARAEEIALMFEAQAKGIAI